MGNLQNKYHVIIDGNPYIIARNSTGRPYYEKKKAPSFVNKFGSGDSSYRDSTFWQFWAQTNWRNGSQQYKFDDPGKFWKSQNVNINQLEKITLSKKLDYAGQTAAGVKVNVLESWRSGSGTTVFGDGSDGVLTISSNTTEAPIDSSCSGTIGTTSLTATNASFVSGQKILIIQSRGTGVGNYEINTISSYTTGTITTTTPLTYTYTDSGASQAQVRVLKQYSAVTIDSACTYTAKAWDGNVGGILAFLCNGTTTINGTINVAGNAGSVSSGSSASGGSGIGYSGGTGRASTSVTANQGEGSVGASAQSTSANGNGGGGGYSDGNAATGGGGGYAAAGGIGAYDTGATPGTGGAAVGSASLDKLFFGGGGGGGARNVAGTNEISGGGGGGGICAIFSKNIVLSSATGTRINANGGARGNAWWHGGNGAGGSVLIKAQTATLETTKITASGATGGGLQNTSYGNGADGRIHLSYLTSYTGTTTPTLDASQDQLLADNPPEDSFTGFAGTSGGKVYSWDNGTTWTEEFDCRRITWNDDITLGDGDTGVGNVGGIEAAQSQGFTLSTTGTVKGAEVYIKKATGTPGDITVRIETNNAGVPSGTLAHANATTTITAFTDTSYAWKSVEFNTEFTLSASTIYHLVLKTAAAANDNYYQWKADTTSGTYSGGARSTSTNGGSTWSAQSTHDMLFRIKGPNTSVNCSIVSDISGSQLMYLGTGDPESIVNNEARIYSYNGTTWALNKTFTNTYSSQVLSLANFNDASKEKVFVGVGPQGFIYETEDFSTYTVSKNLKQPQNPGYVYVLKEYNRYLYAMGGTPEMIPNQKYNGFVYLYDTTQWLNLYPFTFTVIESAEFYDAYLFIGTYHGQLFVFDTSTLNPIFDWKNLYEYLVKVNCQYYFNDKLYIGLAPQDGSNETNVGIWVYDRHGLSLAHHGEADEITSYESMSNINNELLVGTGNNGYVYKINESAYCSYGYIQSSYFDANLPSINKLYAEVEVKCDPLPTDTAIHIDYKFKEDDDWTALGDITTVGTESQTLSFPNATSSKKITLRYVLTSQDETATPTITDIIMKYSLLPQVKWQWNFKIHAKETLGLRDRTTYADDAETIRQNLIDSLSSNKLVVFTDTDGTDYTTLIHDVEEPISTLNADNVRESLISVSLIEA